MTTKLVGFIVLMFTFALVTSVWLLIPMVIVTAIIFTCQNCHTHFA